MISPTEEAARSAVYAYLKWTSGNLGARGIVASAISSEVVGQARAPAANLFGTFEDCQRLDLLDICRRVQLLDGDMRALLTVAERGDVDPSAVKSAATKTRTILDRLERLRDGAVGAEVLVGIREERARSGGRFGRPRRGAEHKEEEESA